MRRFLALAALSLLTWQSPLRAEEAPTDDATDEAAVDDAISDAERPHPPFGQYNQWHCRARPQWGFRSFVGSSRRFEAGSGLGQEAHHQAHRRALRQCERFTFGYRRCYSDFNRDCWVERFQ